MTAQADPYVRVYYRIIDDDRFATVYDDDARLACWLRLLLVADGTYPAPAPIPASVRRSAFAHLVTVGLVELAPGNRFRIHGMGAERGDRSAKAAAAAQIRWQREQEAARANALAMQAHSGSSATAFPGDMHSAPLLVTPSNSVPSIAAPLPPATLKGRGNGGLTDDQRRAIVARGVLDDRTATESDRADARATLVEVGAPLPEEAAAPIPRPTKKPPDDGEVIAKCRAILADDDAPDWKRQAARDQLAVMGAPA